MALALAGLAAWVIVAPGESAGTREASAPGWTGYASPSGGVAVRFPPGWRAARHDLTPRLFQPDEILSLGTGPLPAGGGGNCGRYPAAAMVEMGRDDALISMQRTPGHPGTRWFDRLDRWPRRFALPAGERFTRRNPGRVWTTETVLRRGGDTLWVLVAFGKPPDAASRNQAERILDTVRLDSA